MANTNFISAANLFGWGQSFNATGKFPLIAKRVWNTYDDMLEFVSDTSDVCPAGVVLTVINDTDSKKNGAYFVAACPTLENPDIEVDVQKIGDGSGSITVENYTAAVASATSDNIGQLVYVLADETIESVEYSAGPYIVTGAGSLAKLGTTSASGDIAGDVETIKGTVADHSSKIEALEGAVSNIDYPVDDVTVDGESVVVGGVAKIDLSAYAKSADVTASISPITEKLNTIEEGATNVQKIVFNGDEIALDTVNHSFTLNTPADKVLGVASTDKVFSLNADSMLEATLSLNYLKTDATEDSEAKYEIQLVGKNAEVISRIDAKAFVKDGMLASVELKNNPEGQTEGVYLVFTFNTESGVTDPIYVPVTELIDVYTAGNGIAIDGKAISAVVKTGDSYLEVTAEGLATKGIDAAILAAKNDLNTTLTAKITSVEEAHSTDVTRIDGLISELKVKDVDTAVSNGVSLSLVDSKVKVGVDPAVLGESLVGKTGEIGSVSGVSIKLGLAITDGSEDATEIIGKDVTVQSAIQTLAGQIQAAVAGGITGISGDEYISVGGTATAKSLTLNVNKVGSALVADDSAVALDENGKLQIVWEEL